MKHLETDSLSNQDISSALAIGVYTADKDRSIIVDGCIDAVAGDGDYYMWVTKQIAGAGSAYVILPKITMSAAAGETAISGQSGIISVRNTDVLTVYVIGLVGDTTTPDTKVRWFESALTDEVAAIYADMADVNDIIDPLSISIDAIATWAAANISSSVTAGAISQIRGNSWDMDLDDLTLDDTLIQFVIKNNANDQDEDSILMIDNVTGLLYVNGEAGTAGDASLAYAGTTLTIEIVAGVTALLPAGVYHYGIQSIDGSGNVSEAYGGTFTITADMVRATA